MTPWFDKERERWRYTFQVNNKIYSGPGFKTIDDTKIAYKIHHEKILKMYPRKGRAKKPEKKLIGLDETKIQYQLSSYLLNKGHLVAIPNVSWSWLYWEADLISITKSNYMYEYEIKVSKSDFENDFKKRKHIKLKSCRGSARIPNYFSYVAPIRAIPLCIPDYAGLIEIQQRGRYWQDIRLIEIKKPKLIHTTKQTDNSVNKMLRSLMFKYWNLAKILDGIKIQRELFN